LGATEINDRFRHFVTMGFEEDKVATKLMQKMLIQDKHPYREINVAGDKAGMLMPIAIKKLADAEHQEG
jgi:hypothetical protein